ncbi:hypothetical protein FOZ63_032654, partial [Perkinsus olseni]
ERLESLVGAFDENVVDSGASDDPAVIWKGRTGKGTLSVEDVMAWLDETEEGKEEEEEEEGKSSRKGDEGESVGMVDGGFAEKKEKDGIADDEHHRSPSRRRGSKRARTNGRGHDAAWAVMTPSGGGVIEEKGGSTRVRRKVSKVDPGI